MDRSSPREAAATAVTVIVPDAACHEIASMRSSPAGVIIMGTHGRGAVTHLLMGSVAEKVVRIAPCPVLTVRHPAHEFILPNALQAVERTRR